MNPSHETATDRCPSCRADRTAFYHGQCANVWHVHSDYHRFLPENLHPVDPNRDRSIEITDEMVLAGARALYDDYMREATFFRDFDEWRNHWEGQARLVLSAAFRDSWKSSE